MSTEPINAEDQHHYLSWQKSNKRGKITTGLFVVVFGILYLLHETGVKLPTWTFTPGPFIIAFGLIVLVKHKFKSFFGYIMIVVGKLLIWKEIYPEAVNMNIIWPVLVILLGLFILFKSKPRSGPRGNRFEKRREFRKKHHRGHRHYCEDMEGIEDLENISQDDFIDAVSIFGGVQKNVVSKNFRGADIVTIFGGNEINLSQADFNHQIVMDVTNLFGGTTLTIPNHWQVKTEMVSIFGGIEDKRPSTEANTDNPDKIVILRGTCMFGGIEINSFNSK
ncbi:MAG: LiaF-related protein [Fluviicola sp.]|nr:LiaF-related protein [Fluviicola sp.]